MDFLGWIVWWTIPGDLSMRNDVIRAKVIELGLQDRVALPAPMLPIDVYRKLVTGARHVYDEDGRRITLELFRVDTLGTMLVAHMVRTVREGRANVAFAKVGEMIYKRPERNHPETGRMRIVVSPGADPQVKEFAARLRKDYAAGQGHGDSQTARRLIRSFIYDIGALLVDNLYFVQSQQDAEALVALVRALGGRSHLIPMVDDEPRRHQLDRWHHDKDTNAAKDD